MNESIRRRGSGGGGGGGACARDEEREGECGVRSCGAVRGSRGRLTVAEFWSAEFRSVQEARHTGKVGDDP